MVTVASGARGSTLRISKALQEIKENDSRGVEKIHVVCLTVRVIAAAFHTAGCLSVVLQLRSRRLWLVCFVLLGESS